MNGSGIKDTSLALNEFAGKKTAAYLFFSFYMFLFRSIS